MIKRVSGNIVEPFQTDITDIHESSTNCDYNRYKNHIKLLKENIIKGNIIQAVPSRRIEKETMLHPFNAYREIRRINPSPYMFYINFIDFQIVGASPETLLKIDAETRIITNHPIAGTRPRGINPIHDQELKKGLLNDPKEVAEHVMLVDLGRNDLSRVCDDVKTTSFKRVEMFSHVMHICSTVVGTINPEFDSFDAFRAVFPAGTVSGAPKISAIQLIYQCEEEKRGVYAGAVGYFGYSGNVDTCIAIRTMVFKNGKCYFQAGGGIVFDSNDDDEYQETCHKMRGNILAVEKAEERFYKGGV